MAYKSLNPGRVTVTSVGGSAKEEMDWVDGNPIFQLVDVKYLEDIRVIAARDNFIAINQTLAVDLTGQIASEGLGHRFLATAGGKFLLFSEPCFPKVGAPLLCFSLLPQLKRGWSRASWLLYRQAPR